MNTRNGIRVVALFEALKGGLALVGSTGLLLLVHRDIQEIVDHLVTHLHLNPAARTPQIILEIATHATPASLRWLALGALLYAVLRWVEAVGLWRGRVWAEWLGILSGLVYVPLELRESFRHPGVEPALALLLNLLVVCYLGWRVRQQSVDRELPRDPIKPSQQ